ncbi:MAG: hypothetical protein V3R80_11110, partial [Candidatus Tectomicrobia bacterium]
MTKRKGTLLGIKHAGAKRDTSSRTPMLREEIKIPCISIEIPKHEGNGRTGQTGIKGVPIRKRKYGIFQSSRRRSHAHIRVGTAASATPTARATTPTATAPSDDEGEDQHGLHHDPSDLRHTPHSSLPRTITGLWSGPARFLHGTPLP